MHKTMNKILSNNSIKEIFFKNPFIFGIAVCSKIFSLIATSNMFHSGSCFKLEDCAKLAVSENVDFVCSSTLIEKKIFRLYSIPCIIG